MAGLLLAVQAAAEAAAGVEAEAAPVAMVGLHWLTLQPAVVVEQPPIEAALTEAT